MPAVCVGSPAPDFALAPAPGPPFVNRKFAEELGVPFPLLSDFNRDASAAYGVLYPDFFGMKGVSKRAVFVVDREGSVAYAWVAEDADLLPPFEEVLEAVGALA